MICPSCRAQTRDGATACTSCGLALAPETLETVAINSAAPVRGSSSGTSRISTIAAPDEGRFLPGTLIAGRYRINSLLGRGGMGEVYRATDLTLAQSVALKFLPESAAGNERLLERFHNEVRVARQVSHPNVCRVYDIGEAEGHPYISMEYVDGEDLASLLGRIGRLPSDKAIEISRRLCAGVAAAHERGVIHRDLKPQNIMLNRRGEVVIMDFGLAAVAEELSGAEARNGTPAYMAPEQLRGDSATAKSDLYALGLIIYELFTGKRAWEATSLQDLISQQETSKPLSITSIASDADPAVEKVILRCLEADPSKRPSSALAVASMLPGGDALAAALAAGEMPSPELVAASGKTEGIALRYAVPCLLVVLAGVLAFPWLRQGISIYTVSPIEHSRPVLENKAREMAAQLGYTAKPRDWQSWFYINWGLPRYLEKRSGKKDWRALYAAEAPYRLMYRESPDYLTSWPDGELTDTRPAMNNPGMVLIQLDGRGRLRRFEGVANRWNAPTPAVTPFDAAPVFQMAGLDITKFQPAAPEFAPPLAFDNWLAWKGMHPGLPDVPLTVEIATWQGRMTSFSIRWPWMGPEDDKPAPRGMLQQSASLFTLLLASIGLLCVVFFARRNMMGGQGDRKGALRIGCAMLVLYLVSWGLRIHWMPVEEMFSYATHEMFLSVAAALLIALLYLAIEPSVRARWPRSLITWNRLLAGQVSDARVGSHILIGCAIGMLMVYVFMWRSVVRAGEGAAPDASDIRALAGVRMLVESFFRTLTQGVVTGSVIFFLVSGMRAVVRYDWLAALIASVLLSFTEGSIRNSTNLWLDLPLYVGIFAAFSFILLRMGLIPAIIGILVINMMSRAPIPPDFTAWYTPYAAVILMSIAVLALYGFWRSQSTVPEAMS